MYFPIAKYCNFYTFYVPKYIFWHIGADPCQPSIWFDLIWSVTLSWDGPSYRVSVLVRQTFLLHYSYESGGWDVPAQQSHTWWPLWERWKWRGDESRPGDNGKDYIKILTIIVRIKAHYPEFYRGEMLTGSALMHSPMASVIDSPPSSRSCV